MTDIEYEPLQLPEERRKDEVASDMANKVRSPWRRYFARLLDIGIYTYFVVAFQALVFHVNMASRSTFENLIDTLIAFLIMMLVEPVLLSKLGTTPGKWLLGLRVTGATGKPLSYLDALSRTVTVFWRGFGLNIPIYNVYRLWRAYKDCVAGVLLDWECDSVIHLKDQKKWRTAVYIAVNISLIVMLTFTFMLAALPQNHGDLTISEFSENYNQLLDFYDMNMEKGLSDSGSWVTRKLSDQNVVYFGDFMPPTFTYTEDGSIMTGMRFKTEIRDSDVWVSAYNTEIALSILAYVSGQEGNKLISSDITELIKQIKAKPFEDFQVTINGVSISCDYEHTGYEVVKAYGTLIPNIDGEETYFSVDFRMETVK